MTQTSDAAFKISIQCFVVVVRCLLTTTTKRGIWRYKRDILNEATFEALYRSIETGIAPLIDSLGVAIYPPGERIRGSAAVAAQ